MHIDLKVSTGAAPGGINFYVEDSRKYGRIPGTGDSSQDSLGNLLNAWPQIGLAVSLRSAGPAIGYVLIQIQRKCAHRGVECQVIRPTLPTGKCRPISSVVLLEDGIVSLGKQGSISSETNSSSQQAQDSEDQENKHVTTGLITLLGSTGNREMTGSLFSRHDGHKQKAHGYYTANDDIVKYGYWIVVILVISTCLLIRLCKKFVNLYASRSPSENGAQKKRSEQYVLLSTGQREMAVAKIKKAFRRCSYPRLASPYPWIQHFIPPTLGQSLFLVLYWAFILAGLWTNVIFESPAKMYGIQWEVVGFRAAWVSTTQLPLLYATGSRLNVVSLMTGITHERLNWFHRWIARTVFMTLIVHWSFFFREWTIVGFVEQELETMPMVIWGFAAWGAIGFMVITGFGWFRDRFFEVWLVSHILSAWAVLALSYTHTHCTTYFVVASAAIIFFDVAGRVLSILYCNILRFGSLKSMPLFGHYAKLEILSEDYLRVKINNPGLDWKPSQHIYINIPRIRLFQSHPFTIVEAGYSHQDSNTAISLIVKRRSGFTEALHKLGTRSTDRRVRAFLQGPYGNPPVVHDKRIGIFIATGNRASFTLSLLKANVEHSGRPSDIIFNWIVPDARMPCWYHEELQQCIFACKERRIKFSVHIHITREQSSDHAALLASDIVPDNDTSTIGRSSTDSDRSSSATIGEKDSVSAAESSLAEACVKDNSSVTEEENCLELEKHFQDNESALPRGTPGTFDDPSSWLLNANEHSGCDLSISHNRPSANELIRPFAVSGIGKIAVVAAVSPVLAANLTSVVSHLLKESNSDIELWIEENGS